MKAKIKSFGIALLCLNLFSFRTNAQGDNNQIGIELYRLVSGNYDLYDLIYCNVVRGGNAGFDNNDLPKLDQFNENVALSRNGRDFAIETRPLPNCTDTIQLRIYKMNVATYRIVIDMLQYPASPGLTPVMQDVFLNTERTLKFGDTSHINFAVTSNTSSAGLRFRIVFRRTQVQTDPFTQIPAICRGAAINLPLISSNGIKGTWTPAVNNTATTTYTFIPSEGQCATSPTMTVQVNQPVTPLFTQLGPFNIGTSFTLPTNSNNGISGNWTPNVNTSSTTTYTFNPAADQCATTAQMTVQINNPSTSVFNLSTDNGISVYPNPVQNGTIQLFFRNQKAGMYHVRMLSVNGKSLDQNSFYHIGGSSAVKHLNSEWRYAPGLYLLEIQREKEEARLLKVFVE